MALRQGDIYWGHFPSGMRRPLIVVSREELNRGLYAVVVPCTTGRLNERSGLPSCVVFHAGQFGLPRSCVAQAEMIQVTEKANLDVESGAVGRLDSETLRDLVKAIGYVLDAELEPQ